MCYTLSVVAFRVVILGHFLYSNYAEIDNAT